MITIVTAFFNINRANWSSFSRSYQTYVESFSKWAHLENNLIVYLEDKRIRDEVIRIRTEYGLLDKTIIHMVDSIDTLDSTVYGLLKDNSNNKIHRLWRYKPDNPEVVNADYNYVMYLKFWCIDHAARFYKVEGHLAWMDFGYAHNGVLFPYEEDYMFYWDYDFGDKVTLFSVKDIDDRPAFDIINTMDTYIMGCIFIVPADKAQLFFKDIRQIILSILTLGYMDDDQIMLLIALRYNPKYIRSLPSSWFMPIKDYGNKYMRTIKVKNHNNLVKTILKETLNFIYRLRYFCGLNSHIRTIHYK